MLGQMSIVLSRGILLKNESTFKLPITREVSCSTISIAKKVSLMVNSLDATEIIPGGKSCNFLY